MTISSVFLFAPAEVASVDTGPAAYAISLAKAHGARLTIFAVALDVTTPGRESDASTVAASLCGAAEAAGLDCTVVTEHSHALAVHEVVAEHARLHDLSITGCDSAGLLSEKMVAEYLMFESGRPVIIVPKRHVTPYDNSMVAVAWDNSAAAARALGDVVALIAPPKISFLTIEGEKPLPTDLKSAAIVELTRRRGASASHNRAALAGRSIATALQQEAGKAGAGLLAMGAFGHSRLRRFVLGSATSAILKDIEMPTLLSH